MKAFISPSPHTGDPEEWGKQEAQKFHRPLALLCLAASLIGLAPLDSLTFSPVPLARNASAIAGLLLVLLFLPLRRGRLEISGTPVRIGLAFAFYITLLQLGRLVFAPDAAAVSRALILLGYLQIVVLFFIISDLARDRRAVPILMGTVTCAAVLTAGIVLFQITGGASQAGRAALAWWNPNEQALFLALGLVCLLWHLLQPGSPDRLPFGRAIAILLYALVLFALVASGSRGGILAMASGTIVLLLLSFEVKRAPLFLGTIMIVGPLTAALFSGNEFVVARFAAAIDGSSVGGRPIIWEAALDMLREKPYLGWGVGFSGELGGRTMDGRVISTHNTYLQIALAFGLFGGAIWLTWVLSTIKGLLRLGPSPYRTLMLASLALMLTGAFFNDFARDKYFIAVLGLASGLIAREGAAVVPKNRLGIRRRARASPGTVYAGRP